jgi:hypothetical protein
VARTEAVRPTSIGKGDMNARPPTLNSFNWMGQFAGTASHETPLTFARNDRRRSGTV